MSERDKNLWQRSVDGARSDIRRSLTAIRDRSLGQIGFWLVALAVGVFAGLAAVAFRLAIEGLQSTAYQTDGIADLHHTVPNVAWYWVLFLPVVGGLIVGLILHHYTPDGRVRAVADVIEGAALYDGKVERKEGIASMFASLITLSSGGSSGREGPVVHFAAVISTYVSSWIKSDSITSRDLLGCAVAAAVSASFNAPIAGALFAQEVVLRHFAVRSFAPIVVASVAGTIVSRIIVGDTPEFILPDQSALEFYAELPAFAILGLFSGLIAFVLMRSVFWADAVASALQSAISLPRYLRPAGAGFLLGLIALQFPHIIGVGYSITFDALSGNLILQQAIVFAAVKVVAVAITIGGRMGGGVFSPALVVGALSGLAFGLVATAIVPSLSGTANLYALSGMGAVAAAVLGAPISTTLIVFELTGDWQTGLAVMVAVSLSTALASRLVDKSFFLTQLERRDVHVAAGPQAYLLSTFNVASVMRATTAPRAAPIERCEELVQSGLYISHDATLDQAMPIFETSGERFIPVVSIKEKGAKPEIRGALFHVDALRAFNRALAAASAEAYA